MRKKKWTDKQLRVAVKTSKSIHRVIGKLGLVPAGGNYVQVAGRIEKLEIDIGHFTGKGWRKGSKIAVVPARPLTDLLMAKSTYQSHKLKKRLFKEGLKNEKCEECGWSKLSEDGRLPLELDHINGDKQDNRLINLRILCPNCHSLKPTHRGRNKGRLGWRNR